MQNIFDIKDKIALITGSSQGLGYIMAQGMGKAGAVVILNSRNERNLKKATDELIKQGIKAESYAFDITDEKAVKKTVVSIEKKTGPIDILVNNAGVNKRSQIENCTLADWHININTNLTGTFLCSREVAQNMIKRNKGKIINICSLMSEIGRPTTGAYAAAKGGVKMLTKAMATEWSQYNIQVNGIGPGYFITEMTKHLADDPEFNSWICQRTPAGRWGQPEELIGTVLFLASSASNFVNGQIIYVDGGILASL